MTMPVILIPRLNRKYENDMLIKYEIIHRAISAITKGEQKHKKGKGEILGLTRSKIIKGG